MDRRHGGVQVYWGLGRVELEQADPCLYQPPAVVVGVEGYENI